MVPTSMEELLLFSTLRLEVYNEARHLNSIGTGFLVKANVNDTDYVVLLVSNKHVLRGGKYIRIRFHKKAPDGSPALGSTIEYFADYTAALREHPDPHIDLACLNMYSVIQDLGDQIFVTCLDESLLATFNEPELNVAQRVLFVGYPNGRFDYANNLPIVRTGLIASHPKVDFDGKKQFVIDAQVFQGSSGSPVIIDLTYENYKNEIVLGEHKIRLLGVVAATMVKYNRLVPVTLANLVSTENLGLGLVFKSTALRELIDLVVQELNPGQKPQAVSPA